jgi:signal peptidase I
MLLVAVVVLVAALVPAYMRAYRVVGWSDAPSFLVGDRILINKTAYDIRLPYTDVVLFSHSKPGLGEVVLFRSPGDGALVFKRVAGRPGDTVVIQDSHLEIDGSPLRYERVKRAQYESVAVQNELGAIIEREIGLGPPHLMTHTPGASTYASFGPFRVPEDHYFVLGDNRDHSEDSRMYGCIPRESIVGRVIGASGPRS